MDGVGDDHGLLVAGEVLVVEVGGVAGECGSAGKANGGSVLAGTIGALVGSRGCNLGTVVQLY